MHVGIITQGGQSFDLLEYAETDSVLSRQTGRNRFIYKDEQNRMIILERQITPLDTIPAASPVVISNALHGYGECQPFATKDIVARTLVPIQWGAASDKFKTRSIVDTNGVTRFAALVPVKVVS